MLRARISIAALSLALGCTSEPLSYTIPPEYETIVLAEIAPGGAVTLAGYDRVSLASGLVRPLARDGRANLLLYRLPPERLLLAGALEQAPADDLSGRALPAADAVLIGDVTGWEAAPNPDPEVSAVRLVNRCLLEQGCLRADGTCERPCSLAELRFDAPLAPDPPAPPDAPSFQEHGGCPPRWVLVPGDPPVCTPPARMSPTCPPGQMPVFDAGCVVIGPCPPAGQAYADPPHGSLVRTASGTGTLRDALAAFASDGEGGAVLLARGDYVLAGEPLVIPRDVALIGACPEATRIFAGELPVAIEVAGDAVTLHGFHVEGGAEAALRAIDHDATGLGSLSIGPGPGSGVSIIGGTNVRIQNLFARGRGGSGLELVDTTATLSVVAAQGTGEDGVSFGGGASTISDLVVLDVPRHGVILGDGAALTVDGAEMGRTGIGLVADGADLRAEDLSVYEPRVDAMLLLHGATATVSRAHLWELGGSGVATSTDTTPFGGTLHLTDVVIEDAGSTIPAGTGLILTGARSVTGSRVRIERPSAAGVTAHSSTVALSDVVIRGAGGDGWVALSGTVRLNRARIERSALRAFVLIEVASTFEDVEVRGAGLAGRTEAHAIFADAPAALNLLRFAATDVGSGINVATSLVGEARLTDVQISSASSLPGLIGAGVTFLLADGSAPISIERLAVSNVDGRALLVRSHTDTLVATSIDVLDVHAAASGAAVVDVESSLATLSRVRVQNAGEIAVRARAGEVRLDHVLIAHVDGAGVVAEELADLTLRDALIEDVRGHGVHLRGASAALTRILVRTVAHDTIYLEGEATLERFVLEAAAGAGLGVIATLDELDVSEGRITGDVGVRFDAAVDANLVEPLLRDVLFDVERLVERSY